MSGYLGNNCTWFFGEKCSFFLSVKLSTTQKVSSRHGPLLSSALVCSQKVFYVCELEQVQHEMHCKEQSWKTTFGRYVPKFFNRPFPASYPFPLLRCKKLLMPLNMDGWGPVVLVTPKRATRVGVGVKIIGVDLDVGLAYWAVILGSIPINETNFSASASSGFFSGYPSFCTTCEVNTNPSILRLCVSCTKLTIVLLSISVLSLCWNQASTENCC